MGAVVVVAVVVVCALIRYKWRRVTSACCDSAYSMVTVDYLNVNFCTCYSIGAFATDSPGYQRVGGRGGGGGYEYF